MYESKVNLLDLIPLFFLFTRYGKIYTKVAKKCMEKGADYAKNEIQRLERMLSKVNLLCCYLCLLDFRLESCASDF